MTFVATHRLNPEHLRRNEMRATLAHAAANASVAPTAFPYSLTIALAAIAGACLAILV